MEKLSPVETVAALEKKPRVIGLPYAPLCTGGALFPVDWNARVAAAVGPEKREKTSPPGSMLNLVKERLQE
jgi:hypothetical protein